MAEVAAKLVMLQRLPRQGAQDDDTPTTYSPPNIRLAMMQLPGRQSKWGLAGQQSVLVAEAGTTTTKTGQCYAPVIVLL